MAVSRLRFECCQKCWSNAELFRRSDGPSQQNAVLFIYKTVQEDNLLRMPIKTDGDLHMDLSDAYGQRIT